MLRASRYFILAVFMALSLGCSSSASAQTRDTVRITSGDWSPFMSEKGPHYGLASHIVTEAFALAEVDVEYGFFPWSRSLKLAQEGKWDGSSVWWEREERYEFFYYSEAVVPTTMVFFHLKGKEFDWESYEDLSDLKVGGSDGYNYGKEFNEAEAAGVIQTDRGRADDHGLKKLLKGRIDIFPGEIMNTYLLIRSLFPAEKAALFTHHPKPVFEEPLHLILSKKVPGNEKLLLRFNKGLGELKQSGRWDQMIADGLAGKYDAKSE